MLKDETKGRNDMTKPTPLSKKYDICIGNCRTLDKQLDDLLPKEFDTQYNRDIQLSKTYSLVDLLKESGIKSFDEVNFEFELQLGGSERNYVNVNMLYFNPNTGSYAHEIVAFYSIDKCLDENFETTLAIIKALAIIEEKRIRG